MLDDLVQLSVMIVTRPRISVEFGLTTQWQPRRNFGLFGMRDRRGRLNMASLLRGYVT